MIDSIQYLRGFAALIVVLFHTNKALITHIFPNEVNYFNWGESGVDLFFIISGFIMAYITYDKNINIRDFFLKRAIRIYPIYWVYVTIALIIFLINPNLINRSSNSPTLVAPSYLLVPYTEFTNLVLVAWTLIYEIHFYFIFAFSLLLSNKLRYIFTGLFLSFLALSSTFSYQSYYLNFITNSIILEFLMGMIVYFIVFKKNDKFNLYILSSLLFSTILLLLLLNSLNYRILYYGIPSIFLILTTLFFNLCIKNILNKYIIISKLLLSLGNSWQSKT